MAGRRVVALAAAAALVLGGSACERDERPPLDRVGGTPTTAPGPVVDAARGPDHPKGGIARVGVWSEPDPSQATPAGAAVRSLVYPSLFVLEPDGTWAPMLAAPASVTTGPGGRSASFRIRRAARWSDGSRITVDDLRRTADPRFVDRVGGPAADGTITVHFTHRLRGWQRLWSGSAAIPPPRPGLFGGPFRVASRTPDLKIVLRPNRRWWGTGPFLDEVRFVLVPSQEIGGRLLERGELDVLMPMAATQLTAGLDDLVGVSHARAQAGGWFVALVANPDRLRRDQRQALMRSVDRHHFVDVLLRGEATVRDGFVDATDGGGAWRQAQPGDVSALRSVASLEVTSFVEVPMAGTLLRSMQRRASDAGATVDLRTARASVVADWYVDGDFDAALVFDVEPPWPCWTCRWASYVDDRLTAAADGGAAGAVRRLESTLRDEGLVLPIWRERPAVAWRDGLEGVEPNGWATSPAWNAWRWWRD